MSERCLRGKRILIVEDEFIVAIMVEDMLSEFGAVIAASVRTIEQATDFAREGEFDIAVLDVNVRGSRINPVAAIIASRGIPFVLATGYSSVELGNIRAGGMIEKPYTPEKLKSALCLALDMKENQSVEI